MSIVKFGGRYDMTSSSNKKQDRKLRKLADSILKRENDWLEVKGYQLGDIQTEQNVKVTEKAALVGNVLAPRVTVAGIIYGFVASREILVESSGQIWGDVHSVSLNIAPGGKLHGWISTLDEGTVDLLRTGDLSKIDLDETNRRTIPQEILDILPGDVVPSDGQEAEPRLLIWRQLRAEAAMALLARSEIEATFERRLMDLLHSSSTSNKSNTKN
jgi:cytoskeletal protein CcmA (bactofilin family)